MMRKFLIEIKGILKDKVMLFLIFAGPILLTIYFGGIYYNTYLEDIPIAVLDEDNSQMSRSIIQCFDENDRFVIKESADSSEKLKDTIDKKEVYMGIYIPNGFEEDVKSLNGSKVLLLTNGTNIVISNTAYATAATIIKTVSAGVEINILEAKGFLPSQAMNTALVFNIGERMLYDPRLKYSIYLLLPFVAIFLQQLMLSGLGMNFLNNGKDIAKDKTIEKVVLKVLSCSTFAIISIYLSILIAKHVFLIPIRGNVLSVLIYSLLFIFAVACPALILAAITRDRLKLSQISFMLSLPTFLTSGAVWPKEMIPKTLLTFVKLFWPLINFDRQFSEILIKGASISNYSDNIIGIVIYIAIWMPIGIILFKRRFREDTL